MHVLYVQEFCFVGDLNKTSKDTCFANVKITSIDTVCWRGQELSLKNLVEQFPREGMDER